MTATRECDCYPGGITADNFEGPKEDCPVHGRKVILETRPYLLPRAREDWDDLPGYWKHGLTVAAQNCPICGWFAKVVAFSHSQHWTVTDCRRDGMVRVDWYWAPLWKPREIRSL